MKQLKDCGKITLIKFISVMLLMSSGCAVNQEKNRGSVKELGITQSKNKNKEFVYCDIQGGAWACSNVTKKTKIVGSGYTNTNKKVSKDYAFTPVKKVINKIKSQNTVVQSPYFEQPVPDNKPTAIFYFPFNSSVLAEKQITQIQNLKWKLRGKTIEIHGYTDSIGSVRYNDWLAKRRAMKIAKALGLSGIRYYGHGRCCYAEPNSTAESRSRNRRAEVYVIE